MRRALLCAAFGLLALLPVSPAFAADWSVEAGLISDYRYRGVSLSGNKPALQASLDAEFSSGPYAELWVSSIRDEGAGRMEADLTIGYARGLTDAISLDTNITYYIYPADPASNAVEFSAAIEAEQGPLALSIGASLAPPQRGTKDEEGAKRSNVYTRLGASYRIGKTPFAVRAGLGRETGPWDMTKGSKCDWSAGVEAGLDRANLSLDFVGSNADNETLVGAVSLRF